MKHRLFPLLLLLALLPGWSVPVCGEEAETALRRHRINIGKLRQEIRFHLDKIRESGQQEMSLLEELEKIDQRLAAQKEKLRALQKRLDSQKALLVLKQQDKARAEKVRENVRRHLEKRLRAYYLMGRTGFLNVTFSSRSLPDLILFNEAYTRLLQYNQSVIDMYRQTIEQLAKAARSLELEKKLLEDFVRQAREEKEKLALIRAEKEELLTRVRTRKQLHEQAVREMRRAEEELARSLMALKEKQENRTRGFERARGRLLPPVTGHLGTGFGEPLPTGGTSKGIVVKTAENAPVIAVFDGRVLFAGYRLGYGNMVIVDHGARYYTITAHLDDIRVKEGDTVRQGQEIGTTGDIATLFSRGMYFEIRRGTTPLDPLAWLRPNSYPRLIPLPLPKVTPLPLPDSEPQPEGDDPAAKKTVSKEKQS